MGMFIRKIKGEVVFEPFKLEIEVRTEKDLCTLWHRFKIDKKDLKKPSNTLKHSMENSNGVWDFLNNIVIERELIK